MSGFKCNLIFILTNKLFMMILCNFLIILQNKISMTIFCNFLFILQNKISMRILRNCLIHSTKQVVFDDFVSFFFTDSIRRKESSFFLLESILQLLDFYFFKKCSCHLANLLIANIVITNNPYSRWYVRCFAHMGNPKWEHIINSL